MSEMIMRYKCGCGDEIHTLTTGMVEDGKEKKPSKNIKCMICNKKINFIHYKKLDIINGEVKESNVSV